MRLFVNLMLGAAGLALLAVMGLWIAMALAADPVVDFSTVGKVCKVDAQCAPSPAFEGIHPECWDGRCTEVKYVTQAEVYWISRTVIGLFVFSPLCMLLLVLGLAMPHVASQVLLQRSASKGAVAWLYGTMALIPWIAYLTAVL